MSVCDYVCIYLNRHALGSEMVLVVDLDAVVEMWLLLLIYLCRSSCHNQPVPRVYI